MNKKTSAWRELFSVLSWHLHGNDAHPLDTVNRLVSKAVGTKVTVSRETHTVYECEATLTELMGYRQNSHTGYDPRNINAPIILVRHNGQLLVVDGQNRINYFIRTHDWGLHRCLVLEAKECAYSSPEKELLGAG